MLPRASSRAVRALFGSGRAAPALGEAELRLLRTFLVVVAVEGFSAAAGELAVDLSTVSKQFRELEQLLGVRLAQRGRGGFRLTAAGETLLPLARRLFAAIGDFGDGARALMQQSPQVLRLGLVDGLLSAASGLSAALAACVDALPGLQLHLQAMTPQDIERSLIAGTLDAGITAAGMLASGLEQHPLCDERNNLYVAPGHAWYEADAAEALDLALACFVTDPYCDELPDAALAPFVAAAPCTRADSLDGVALLVATGRFAGFLPDHLVRAQPMLRMLRAVAPARFGHSMQLVLACKKGNAAEPLRQLLRHVRALNQAR